MKYRESDALFHADFFEAVQLEKWEFMKPKRISVGNDESINSLSTRYILKKEWFTIESGKTW